MEASTVVARRADVGVADVEEGHSPSIPSLMHFALEKGADVATLERLVALQERIMERDARAAFVEALAAFQAEVEPIVKEAAITTTDRAGVTSVRSRYAKLDAIADAIREPLTRHGFMYRWDSAVDGGDVEIRCIVTHRLGHSETSSFRCPLNGASAPGMNAVQAMGSAQTYGMRYSLTAALGLTTANPDDDGHGAGPEVEKITDAQLADLEALIKDVGADRAGFLKYLKLEALGDLPASRYQQAIKALEEKRRGRK